MIIDIHAHWWPSDEYVFSKPAWTLTIKTIAGGTYRTAGVEADETTLRQQFFDPQAAQLLRQMDEAGIQTTVLLPLDWDSVGGAAEKDVHEQNRIHAALAKAHPERIVSFYSIDPRRPNAAAHFRQAVEEWGMKGLKLYPPTGFYPYDDRCAPLYAVCIEKRLPVVFHGSSSPMATTQYCRPEGFAKLATAFPTLRIVIAHAGGEWVKDAAAAYRAHGNIYLDISGWQTAAKLGLFGSAMRQLLEAIGSFERVMFGTDNPIFTGILPAKDWVAAVQGLDIPDGEKDNLLGAAAARLLSDP